LAFIIRIYHDAQSSECKKLHKKTPYSTLKHKHNKPEKAPQTTCHLTLCSSFTKELTTFSGHAEVILEVRG